MTEPVQVVRGATHASAWAVVGTALVASSGAALLFSRLTGWTGPYLPLPVGTGALVLAVSLTARAPRRFGWRWGDTGRHWGLVLAAAAAVVGVVGLFCTRP